LISLDLSCVFLSFFRKEIGWGVTGVTLFLNFSLFEALAADLRALSDDVGSTVLRAFDQRSAPGDAANASVWMSPYL
jgi:hypothetical protein